MNNNELLKQKILDNAIHGTLVKNDLTLPSVDVEEVTDGTPLEIPSNWKWVHLKSVAFCKTGNSINEREKLDKYSDINVEGLNYISTKDININSSVNYKNGIKIPNNYLSKFKIAKKNSTLICIEGGSAGKKIGFITQDVCYVNKLCCIYSKIIDNKYIYYFLKTTFFINEFNSKKTGIIGGVSVKNLEKLLIPLPPLEEQKRIVAKIDKLFNLIEQFE